MAYLLHTFTWICEYCSFGKGKIETGGQLDQANKKLEQIYLAKSKKKNHLISKQEHINE